MSNGDDVLDNWEEIDEVGLTNRLQKIQNDSKNQQKELKSNTTINATTNTTTQTTYSTADLNNSSYYNIKNKLKSEQNSYPQQMKVLQRPQTQQAANVIIAKNGNKSLTSATSTSLTSSTTVTTKSANSNAYNNVKPQISSSSAATSDSDTNSPKSPLDDMAATFQPVMMVLHKPQDEYQSTTYAQPTINQTVKILRRPTQSSEQRDNGGRPRQPFKSLQQREQEYAEARLRILGAAKNPEDDETAAAAAAAIAVTKKPAGITKFNSVVPTTSPSVATTIGAMSPMGTPAQQLQQQLQQLQSSAQAPVGTPAQQTFNPITNYASNNRGGGGGVGIISGGIPHNMYNNQFYHIPQQQQQQPQQIQLTHQQQLLHQNFFFPTQQQQQQQQQPKTHTPNAHAIGIFNNTRPHPNLLAVNTSPPTLPLHMQYQQQPQQPQQQQQQQAQLQLQQQQSWSPIVGGVVSSPTLRQQQQGESILRSPHGPDGTTGFQLRR